MNFIDWRLSDKFSHEFTGGPDWFTNFKDLENGTTKRDGKWDYPHHRYVADYTMLKPDALAELRQATYVLRGRLYSCRFRDPDDWEVIEPEIFGIGDGTSNPKQLIKTYNFGPIDMARVIRLPIGVTIFADEVEIAATVNPLTGMVTPTAPWPDGDELTWVGQFDVPVMFANDYNPLSMRGPNLRSTNVELVEDMSALVALI